MQIRNIPFGYKFENGEIVIHTQERKSVIEIFKEYISGNSLLNIARRLNERNVEYRPGFCGWNKARLKRIIEDRRYLGEKNFPKIIDEQIFEQSSTLKCKKNTQKYTDRQSNIFNLNVPVCCPRCQSVMRRQCNNRNKNRERWVCGNKLCKAIIIKADKDLFNEINMTLNDIAKNYEIISVDAIKTIEMPKYLSNLDRKIKDMFRSEQINKDIMRQSIYAFAADSYNEINVDFITSQKLRDIFVNHNPTDTFCKVLFDKTVKRIFFDINGKVGLELINGQEIR